MQKERKKLGEMLMEAGLIDNLQLNAALSYQREWGGRLGSILLKRGLISQQDIISVIEKQAGIPCVSYFDMKKPSPELMKLVKHDIAKKFCVFPIAMEGRMLTLATADPTDLKTLDEIGFHLNVRVKAVLSIEEDIEDAIDVHYGLQPVPPRRSQSERDKLAQKALSRGRELDMADPEKAASSPGKPDAPQPPVEMEIIHMHQESKAAAKPPVAPKPAAAETPNLKLLDSVISLLIEKGVFTRDELLRKIQSKKP